MTPDTSSEFEDQVEELLYTAGLDNDTTIPKSFYDFCFAMTGVILLQKEKVYKSVLQSVLVSFKLDEDDCNRMMEGWKTILRNAK